MINLKTQGLHWELTVLAEAVAYSNLSSASENIGVSQSQLSRIVSKIEIELGVVLLDRAAPRKSSWLTIAHELSRAYMTSARRLDGEVRSVIEKTALKDIRLGTLEGLIEATKPIVRNLLSSKEIERVHVEVEDLSALEAMFSRGELDFLITIRQPGRKKYKWVHFLGHQPVIFEEKKSSIHQNLQLFSTYEYAVLQSHKLTEKTLVSNSLEFRKHWIDSEGGKAWIPGAISQKPLEEKKNKVQVVRIEMLARDDVALKIWEQAIR